VIGELTQAADALRERDRVRARELERRLVDLDKAMEHAEVRAGTSRLVAELAWESVLDALWEESWMTLRRRPRADPRADPARLDELDETLQQATAAVLDAVRRRTFGRR
jgi:hypothetical protein